jgi:hypothetical protein
VNGCSIYDGVLKIN